MFSKIFDFFHKKKVLFYLLLIAVFSVLILIAKNISFEEDITKLLPSSEKSEKIKEVLSTAKYSDKLVVNIKGSSTEDLKQYAQSFDSLIQQNCKSYINKIQVRAEQDQITEVMDFVQTHLPLFLEEKDYQQIDQLLQPDSIQSRVQESYHSISSPNGWVTTNFIRQDPLGMTFLGLKKLQQFQTVDNFLMEDGYLISKEKKNLLIFITTKLSANETNKNAEFIKQLDENILKLNEKYTRKAQAEYYGATAVAVANAQQIKTDIQITMSVAFVVLFALYIYFYRRFFVPLIIFIPALFGSLLGIAVLYLLRGTISAVSIGIGSVLLGITLDYAVHILSHYRSTGNIKKLFRSIVSPLLLCAIFTAVDFLCLMFLHSDVLKDLGLFAAVSVMGAALFSLVFIPQVYTPNQKLVAAQNTFVDKIAGYDVSRNNFVLLGCVLITIISLFTYNKVGFNNDLNSMNYVPENLKKAEKNLDALMNYSSKTIYMISYGDSYEEALQINHNLYKKLEEKKANHSISGFSSIGGIVLSKQEQLNKIDKWNQFWTPEKKEKLKQQLIAEGRAVGFKENTFAPFYNILSEEYTPLDQEGYQLFQELFLDEFISVKKDLTGITTIVKTDASDTRQLVKDISSSHKNVLVIDRKYLQEEILGNLEKDFDFLFFISSVIVFLAVFIYFRSIEITLLTNIPIFIGWFVTLGIMGIFNIEFNAFNIIITTLIFGLGIDYSIFISEALLEEYTYGKTDMKTYRAGIIMSAVTTLLCFGVLIFSKHPAIQSIAVIPLIGLLIVVLISFTIQPWLFRVLLLNPQKKGYTPFRAANFIFSIISFGYFLLTAFVLNILAFILFPIIPAKREVRVKYLHKIFRTVFRSVIFLFPLVKIKKINHSPALYNKPCIIIANHTSELDTIILGMQDSRQIFMINERIYNSKFFGKAIRLVDYYPSTRELEEGKEKLKEKIEQGYSIIIFPEGTRSINSGIHRFHKGAFYLAEQLQLDILPVLIHGNADVMPKKETLVNQGKITLKFLDKIAYNNPEYGHTYSERTKQITAYFREEFQKFKTPLEQPDYFKQKLFLNYLYKDRQIQKEVRQEYQLNKNIYQKITELIPQKAKTVHLGSGYGVLDFLLTYSAPQRKITAWEKEEEKRTVAQNCYSVQRYKLNFVDKEPENSNIFEVLICIDSEYIDLLNSLLEENIKWLVISTEMSENLSDKFILVYKEQNIEILKRR